MKNSRGYILLVTFFVSGILMLLSFSFVNFFMMEKGFLQREKDKSIAEEASYAGVTEAVYQLESNLAWNSTLSNVSLTASGATYNITFNPASNFYSTNNSLGNSLVTGYGGRQVPPKMVHIVSLGRSGGVQYLEEALIGGSPFKKALLANNAVTISGSVTVDSMTSPGSGGNIGTNSGSNGIVTLNGNVAVNGIISVGGDGGALSITSNGGASYQGYEVSPGVQNMPVVLPPAGANLGNKTYKGGSRVLPPGNYGKLTMSSNALVTLQSGNYVFTDDITSTGCTLRLQPGAAVKIYAGKNILFSGTNNINVTMTNGRSGRAYNLLFFLRNNTTFLNF